MKKVLIFLLGMSIFTACSERRPGNVFLKYANEIIEGDLETFCKGLCRDGEALTPAQDSLAFRMMQLYKETMQKNFQGIKSVEVISDSLYDQGNRSTLRIRLHFGNAQEEETEVEMMKVDNDWKINILQ